MDGIGGYEPGKEEEGKRHRLDVPWKRQDGPFKGLLQQCAVDAPSAIPNTLRKAAILKTAEHRFLKRTVSAMSTPDALVLLAVDRAFRRLAVNMKDVSAHLTTRLNSLQEKKHKEKNQTCLDIPDLERSTPRQLTVSGGHPKLEIRRKVVLY